MIVKRLTFRRGKACMYSDTVLSVLTITYQSRRHHAVCSDEDSSRMCFDSGDSV